jgi:hypothetical protein
MPGWTHFVLKQRKTSGKICFVNFCAHLCEGNVNVDTQQQRHSNCKQCCGSGYGIRCLFDPWIRDLEYVLSGSRISNPYFWLKSTIILLNWLKFYKIIFQFCDLSGYKKLKKGRKTRSPPPPSFFAVVGFGIRDPGPRMYKNQDLG